VPVRYDPSDHSKVVLDIPAMTERYQQSEAAKKAGLNDRSYVANSIVSSATSGRSKRSSAATLPGACITPVAAARRRPLRATA
jgi:hypothetical protein